MPRAPSPFALLLVSLLACGDDGGTGGAGSTASTSSSSSASTATASSTGSGGAGGAAQGGASAGGAGTGAGGEGGAVDLTTAGVGGGPGESGRIRVVAANLSSGNGQTYTLGHGIRILQGLDGDVVLLQELNYQDNSAVGLRNFADEICGSTCGIVRGPNAEIPNGIVSRYPILDSGSFPDPEVQNRTFVWARIDVPGDRDLLAFSLHWLTSSASARSLEADALVGHLDGMVGGDFLVLGGDLNTNTRGEGAIDALAPWVDVDGPYPVDQDDVGGTNTNRDKPYDWVLVDPDLRGIEIPVAIGSASFPAGLVVDTRVYEPIEDLAPALVTDSEASGMQHMAVVRDFFVDP